MGKLKGIDCTYFDKENRLMFRRVYKSRKGFLSALKRNKSDICFIDAIDMERLIVIKPDTLKEYIKMK